MLGIVLRALRRRRVHATTLFLLGLIAATAAAAAPGYATASAESLAATELGEATASEHLVTVAGDVALPTTLDRRLAPLDDMIARTVDLPGFDRYNEARVAGQLGDTRADLVYRDDMCDRLTVTGSCPTKAGEVAIAPDYATLLKAGVGSVLTYTSRDVAAPMTLHVVGIYQPTDPADPYWGPSQQAEDGTVTGQRFRSGTMFTPMATFVANRPRQAHITVDFVATPTAVRDENPQFLARSVDQAVPVLGTQSLNVSSAFRTYADRTLGETNLVYIGVIAATVQLLILVWFALALAVRQTGESRRPDIALMKLRGVGRRSQWSLAGGQAALPIVTGGVLGLAVGAVGVRYWAGQIQDPQDQTIGLVATVGAAVIAIVIAVVSALVAERRMLAQPVAELGRRVPARARGWRAGILDAALIALALAAALELRSTAVATDRFRGLDVLAPTLVALAVGIVAAWLVPRAARLLSTPSLRVGRLSIGLSAVNLARRTALPRVLTMLTLAIAVVTGAAINWAVAERAQQQRAGIEVGADRVLTVQTSGSVSLLDAVRAADPDGRYAMAVVRTLTTGTPTLAVDSSRLAAVVPWFPAYGLPHWSTVATALRASATSPMTVHNGAIRLDATWAPAPGSKPAQVAAVVEDPSGAQIGVLFGRLRTGGASYQATVTACAPQCRLVGFHLIGTSDLIGSRLTLRQVAGAVTVAPTTFADRARWRTSIIPGDELPSLMADANGLGIAVTGVIHNTASIAFPVFVNDAPTPLPMYAAGSIPPETTVGFGSVQAPGAGPVPAELVGEAALLPRMGTAGRLVDLTEVTQLRPGGGRLEVWLRADTPQSVIQALTDHGLSIVDDDSIAVRLAELRAQGPFVALRYLLVVALVGFVLAVGAFAIAAAVERSDRAEELAALRHQGLSARSAGRVAYVGYVAFAVVAVALGVLTSLLASRLILGSPRVFGDGWSVLPIPPTGPVTLLVIVGALVAVTLAVAVAGGAALARAVRAERTPR